MATETVLQARELSKAFPGVQALDAVSLDVTRGRVHALMGENGAGKSTLMRLLAGLDQPDSGRILLDGRPVRFRNPHDALRGGIAMIHQELMPFPDLTVAENIFMGQEPTGRFPGWINRRRLHREANRLLERLNVALPPGARMRDLSVAEMQTVEIAKALAYDARVVIMDEPTSAISEREVESLFGVIRDLTRRGIAVIYISHRLDEVFAIAETVTVLRDGRQVGAHGIRELTADRLIALMVGRELTINFGNTFRRAPRRAGGLEGGAGLSPPVLPESPIKPDVALSVRGLSRKGRFRDIDFDLRRGEVLGFAGLMGSGRTEIANAIYGLAPADAGAIRVRGRLTRIRSPRDALAQGIAMVTEDRKESGLVLTMSVQQNLTLANLRRCCRGAWVDRAAERSAAEEQIAAFGIKTPDPGRSVASLSGGNQQKVVLAKAMLTEPQILILDEPTRGIDIGAKADVHALIRRLAREGRAILLISSDLPELLALSDRVLVMREGTVAAGLAAPDTTQAEILRYAMPD